VGGANDPYASDEDEMEEKPNRHVTAGYPEEAGAEAEVKTSSHHQVS
jgi:hypothetical protein